MTKAAPAHPREKPHHPHWPLAVVVFALAFGAGLSARGTPAGWLAVATGRLVSRLGAAPRVDPFSFGSAGAPWTTDSWSADAAFAKADALGGAALARDLAAGAAALGFALLLPIGHGDPLAVAGLLGAAALCAREGMTPAPAAFDFLFFALFLRLLRPRRRFRLIDAAAAAALTALWANVHGASAALALAFVFLKAFKASMRSAAREALGYWAMFAACALAFSWNPLGYGLLAHLFSDAAPGALGAAPALWSPAGGAIALGLAACAYTLQQEFVLTLSCATVLALSLALPGLRPLAALAAVPAAALALGHFRRPREVSAFSFSAAAAVAALIVAALSRLVPPPASGGYGEPTLVGAARFLDAERVGGQMFNAPEFGAQLIGLSGRRVFVDARPGVYPETFLDEARDWPRSFPALDAVYRFDYAVVPNPRAAGPARALDAPAAWRLAYADDDALVYLKAAGADAAAASRAPFRVVDPGRGGLPSLDAALSSAPQETLDELDAWTALAPDCVQAWLWKAYALGRLGRGDESDRALARARALPRLARDPGLSALAEEVLRSRERPAAAREAKTL